MKSDDTNFTPDQLDDQIEHPVAWLTPDEQRLVQDLRRAHQVYEHENAQSLHQVWNRLELAMQKQHIQDTTTARTTLNSLWKRKSTMKDRLSLNSPSHGGFQRALSLLIAIMMLTLLIGSAALLFNIVGKKNSNSSNITSSILPATELPVTYTKAAGIYITYPIDGSHVVLSKLDMQTHRPLWVYKNGPPQVGTPVVSGDVVYLNASGEQTNQEHLVALDATTGKEIWNVSVKLIAPKDGNGNSFENMSVISAPVVANGQVYLINRSGTVFAFEAKTGKEAWTYQTGASALVQQYYTDPNTGRKSLAGSTIYDGSTPVVSNGVLYGELHTTYFALDTKTGKPIWSLNITGQDQILTGVQVVDGVVYTSSFISVHGYHLGMALPSYIYAFNAKDGSLRWKYSTNRWVTVEPIVSDGRVYFIERSPNMEIPGHNQSSSTLRVLNVQGHEVWHKDYNVDGGASLIVNQGYVAISQSVYTNGQLISHTLYVYDAKSGKGWQKDVETNPIAIENGVLYTNSGLQIIAYSIKDQNIQWHGQYGVMGNQLSGVVVVP